MCVTHRSSCLSSSTLTFGVFDHSYWKRSTCTWRKCRTFSNLVLVAGHLFRQERKLSSASATKEVRSEITTSLPVYSQESFITHQSGSACHRHLQGWALLQSLTLIFVGFIFFIFLLLWFVVFFSPIRKEIGFVLKSYHIKWFAAPFSSSFITHAAPLPPRKCLRANLALGRLNAIWW